MRILVTGAGGQVGSELVELCAARGDEPLALGRELDVRERENVFERMLAPKKNPEK